MSYLVEHNIKYIKGENEGRPFELDHPSKSDTDTITRILGDPDLFNQDFIRQVKGLLVDSIRTYGYEDSNKFLTYVLTAQNDEHLADKLKTIPFEHGEMIKNELEASTLKLDNQFASKWLYNPQTYKGDIYKLQALLFLSDPDDAKDYGDIYDLPLDKILKSTTKKEIDEILHEWNTFDNPKVSKRRSNSPTPNLDRWEEELQKFADKIGQLSSQDIRRLADTAHQHQYRADAIESFFTQVLSNK